MTAEVREFTVSELLLDLDGTLIDSVAAVEDAWQTWAVEEAVVMPDAALLHGRTANEIVSGLLPAHRVPAAVGRLSELEQHPTVSVLISDGAAELLDAVPAERWAIVTSAARPVALGRLTAAGLQMPSLLIAADDVTRTKPDPEPFFAGMRWAEDDAPAIAFEDTSTGLRAAKAAGCIAVGIIGTESAHELGRYADIVVRSLDAVTVISADGPIVLAIVPAQT